MRHLWSGTIWLVVYIWNVSKPILAQRQKDKSARQVDNPADYTADEAQNRSKSPMAYVFAVQWMSCFPNYSELKSIDEEASVSDISLPGKNHCLGS
jgi:hypothetical protein